jgi:molybdopterin synthase catalytic subunit
MEVSVQEAAFDVGQELNAFMTVAAGSGAVVSFCGVTRDIPGGLQHMEIEHYRGMTERALSDVRVQAIMRFDLTGARIIHRYGRLAPDDVIMMVMTAAPHRADAFKGAEYLMDYLKSRAPFWKREVTGDGAEWVEAKAEDEDALKRW